MDNQGSVGTILIVDGQPSVTKPARDLLEIFRHSVYVAHTGEEAVQQLRTHEDEIDIVIIDLKMSDMHGSECLDQMRQIRPELPAILATGHVVDEDLKQRLAPRIQGYLTKPYTPSELIETIQEILAETS